MATQTLSPVTSIGTAATYQRCSNFGVALSAGNKSPRPSSPQPNCAVMEGARPAKPAQEEEEGEEEEEQQEQQEQQEQEQEQERRAVGGGRRDGWMTVQTSV